MWQLRRKANENKIGLFFGRIQSCLHKFFSLTLMSLLVSFFPAGIYTRSFNRLSTRIFPRSTRACYTVALLLSWRDWACGTGRLSFCCIFKNQWSMFSFELTPVSVLFVRVFHFGQTWAVFSKSSLSCACEVLNFLYHFLTNQGRLVLPWVHVVQE